MIKVFLLSILFFTAEVFFFQWAQPFFLSQISSGSFSRLTFTAKQRRLIHYLEKLDKLNEIRSQAVFVVGGSTAREFFLSDKDMSQALGTSFVNMASANQNMFDTIRLVDNINVSGSTIIFCLLPYKLMAKTDYAVLTGTKYMMGENLKYPVLSDAVKDELKNYASPDLLLNLLPDINVYIYLIRDYFTQKRHLKHNPVAHLLLSELGNPSFKSLFVTEKPTFQYLYQSLGYQDRKKVVQTFRWMKTSKIGPFPDKNMDINLALLEKAIQIGLAKNMRLIAMELPYSSTYHEFFFNEIRVYEDKLSAFFKKHKMVRRISFPYDTYRGEESYFYDYAHLADAGRKFFTPISIEKIKNELSVPD